MTFDEVARLLGKDNQPEGLARALLKYSPLVGARKLNRDDETELEKMLEAARRLEAGLTIEARAADRFRLRIPDCIENVLMELPDCIEYLESQLQPPRGGNDPPDSRRRLCASVCGNAWRRLYGEVQPYSSKLQKACEEYWQACGNPETSTTGRLKNWEPFLVWVKQADDEGFREDFEHLITQPK
jgi:hypothetical protein